MEGLRGIAVMLVFLQHYSVQAQSIGLRAGLTATVAAGFRAYGNLGVELFFVLSGYLIYGTLIRRSQSFVDFMMRRVRRLYPVFLVVFLFALGLALLTREPGKIPQGALQATAYLAANLAFLPGLFPIPPLVAVAWSLSYEMFFYLATAALVLWAGLHRAGPRRRLVVLMLLATGFFFASSADIPGFPVRMMPFFAGMFLAEGLGDAIPSPWGWAVPALALLVTWVHPLPGAAGEELLWTGAFFALCAVCFRGAGVTAACMSWAPLRWLGNMSYSYYLVHGFVVRIAMVILGRLLPSGMPPWLFWSVMPVLFLATLFASAVVFMAVEKPISLRPAASVRRRLPA